MAIGYQSCVCARAQVQCTLSGSYVLLWVWSYNSRQLHLCCVHACTSGSKNYNSDNSVSSPNGVVCCLNFTLLWEHNSDSVCIALAHTWLVPNLHRISMWSHSLFGNKIENSKSQCLTKINVHFVCYTMLQLDGLELCPYCRLVKRRLIRCQTVLLGM